MPSKYWHLSRYHLCVLGLYVPLLVLVTAYTPSTLRYGLSPQDIQPALLVGITTVAAFGVLNYSFQLVRIQLQRVALSRTLILAAFFAIPEEILFRGLIQTQLTQATGSIEGIILSALVFGAAHLPNGAKGIHPKKWNWLFAGVAFLAGFPLAILYAITGSLLLPTLLHAVILIALQLFLSIQEYKVFTPVVEPGI